jgi:hypothetical protein
MARSRATGLRVACRIILNSAAAFTLLVSATACLHYSSEPPRTSEGFDFSFSNDETDPAVGPKIGERIDITSLKARDGKRLSSVEDRRVMMLVTVDPMCGACKAAVDEIRDVQSRIADFDVAHYVVSFTSSKPRDFFFNYVDSLNLDLPTFLWDMSEKKPPEALYTMVMPSHILVDREGVVVRKWPGTDTRKLIRQRMANQIVADTIEEVSKIYDTNRP